MVLFIIMDNTWKLGQREISQEELAFFSVRDWLPSSNYCKVYPHS